MPTYRVRTTDGSEYTIQALRFRTDAQCLYLENREAGLWRSAFEVPLTDIERLQRRLNEANGSWTWVTERPIGPSGLAAT